jgi:site-specific DNA recombinase
LREEGVSGALYIARPGMQKALSLIEAGKANLLICANLSRYSRDAEHQHAIKRRLESAGARLVLCDMDFDATPEGDLAFGIMGNFAAYERKIIRKRTMTGRRRCAENGIQPHRNLSPFGYHVITKEDVLTGRYPAGTVGTYQVIEEQA